MLRRARIAIKPLATLRESADNIAYLKDRERWNRRVHRGVTLKFHNCDSSRNGLQRFLMNAETIGDSLETACGAPNPLGATVRPNGVNFSLYSSGATGVELLLFSGHDSPQPTRTIALVPSKNKTFHFWHIFVAGLGAGTHYAFRVTGP